MSSEGKYLDMPRDHDEANKVTPDHKRSYKCKFCFEEFTQLSVYFQHKKTQECHSKRKYFCILCPHKASSGLAMRKHVYNVHAPKASFSPEPDQYSCDECPKVFERKCYLMNHKRIHRSSKMKREQQAQSASPYEQFDSSSELSDSSIQQQSIRDVDLYVANEKSPLSIQENRISRKSTSKMNDYSSNVYLPLCKPQLIPKFPRTINVRRNNFYKTKDWQPKVVLSSHLNRVFAQIAAEQCLDLDA